MDKTTLNQGLLHFLQDSPTPFHAVSNLSLLLERHGFERLCEGDAWRLAGGGRYFVTRNDSSLAAFVPGLGDVAQDGWRMMSAHTDSPALKVKPQPEIVRQGYLQLGVEVYGGALLNPWFDRDLSLAGRVSGLDGAGGLVHVLVDFKSPVAVIPSLAIHLDREANKEHSINAQTHLPPLLMRVAEGETPSFRDLLLARLRQEAMPSTLHKVLDYELFLYDTQPPALLGLQQEFMAAARLDNLLSCYVGVMALLQSDGARPALLVCNDHEEVGSLSHSGAQGTFLRAVLERAAGAGEALTRAMERSLLISLDNAHGIHPNYADKYDDRHAPVLNRGPVLKCNANQRYASNSVTGAFFRQLCARHDVPLQSFVVRSDMVCGSTLGPITAAQTGVKTVDVGVPTLAMHSIRELAGSDDAHHLYRALAAYVNVAALGG